MESASSTGTGASRSHRSSFAVERLSLDGTGQMPTGNETPQPVLTQEHLELLCRQIGIPKALCNRYALELTAFDLCCCMGAAHHTCGPCGQPTWLKCLFMLMTIL